MLRKMLIVVPLMSQAATDTVSAQQAVVAFTDVSVVPMDRDRILPGQTVLVRNGHIEAIGSSEEMHARVPSDAVRVDGRGKYLIPGLGDMHVQLGNTCLNPVFQPEVDSVGAAERTLLVWLANGITTVRNMVGQPWHVTLRDRLARGELLGPRMLTAGPEVWQVSSEDENAPLVEYDGVEYDFINLNRVYVPPEAFDAFVAATEDTKLPWTGQAPRGVPLARWLGAGPRSSERLAEFTDYIWQEDDSAATTLAARATAIARAGVWSCPTYSLGTALHSDTVLHRTRRVIQALRDAGAGLLLGTDCAEAVFGESPGTAIVRELAGFAQAGLTPYEALATATLNVARFLDAQDSTGTVAVGKRADLVLLNGNPLVDVRNVAQPAGVMIGGRWLSRQTIDELFAASDIPRHWH